MAAVQRNPKDSMKSTWRNDRSNWNRHHYMATYLGLLNTNLDQEVPVFQKTDKMAAVTHFEAHRWVLLHALWPIALQQLYTWYTGKNLGYIAAFILYTLAYKINAVDELNGIRILAHKHGFLDGDKHERDQIPDHAVDSVFRSLFMTSTFRPMICVMLAYSPALTPASTYWWAWMPLEVALYTVILDFWFYWYHRCMHEYEGLWKYHRTHHLTKHPNALLTLYADHEQEFFDIFGVPMMTYLTMRLMGLPMGFYDWWVCHQYIVWTELWGHSGLRLYTSPPTFATPLLKLMNAELTTEDHDLHHRKGWKNSHNYGKQTRLWDSIFGTTHERYECNADNIDWNNTVHLPTALIF